MSRPRATSRKLRRVQVLLALFLVCLRTTQTARAFLGAGAVQFPRSVPPGIWAQNLLVARRAKADGTLDGGEAEDKEDVKGPLGPRDSKSKAPSEKDQVEEATTEAKASFDQGSRNKAVDEAASAQTADPVEDATKDEPLQQTALENEDLAAAKRQRDVALSGLERAEDLTAYLQKQLLELEDSSSEKAKELTEAEQKYEEAKKELKEAEQKYEAKASVQVQLEARDLMQPPAQEVQDLEQSPPVQKLIDLERPINESLSYIKEYTQQADNITHRIPPTCAIRCSRGGKSTFLIELFKRLTEEPQWPTPIWVTFNGITEVRKQVQESSVQWLCRTLAHAVAPPSVKAALANGSSSCSERVLEAYFSRQQDFVLLVDEINLLLTGEDSEADKRAALFLKDNFLKRKGAYLVFTSHIQTARDKLHAYMDSPSFRPAKLIRLSLAANHNELIGMHSSCSGLTPLTAAFYGRIPSIIWLWSMVDPCATYRDVFSLTVLRANVDPKTLVDEFLEEVFTGQPQAALQGFKPLTSVDNLGMVTWIPCYMARFLAACGAPYNKLAEWLEGLRTADYGDGKGWEKLVAVAFGLRYLWAQRGHCHPFAHGMDTGVKLVEFLDARYDAANMSAAIASIPVPAFAQRPSLQLVLPSRANFKTVDLFAIRTEPDGTRKVVMVAQQKEGSKAVGNVTAPQVDGRALWMRGLAKKPQHKHGWYLPSACEVSEFLGPSLDSAAPATWLDSYPS